MSWADFGGYSGISIRVEMRARKKKPFRTLRYVSAKQLQQTRLLIIRTMVTLLQRPPLAMFDPSLIHRNDEIFNPEPNRLGIFFALHFRLIIAYFKALMASKS